MRKDDDYTRLLGELHRLMENSVSKKDYDILVNCLRSCRNAIDDAVQVMESNYSKRDSTRTAKTLRIFLDVQGGVVTDVKFSGSGCSISQSSASMMTNAVKGKDVAQVRAIVRKFKNMMTVEEDTETPIDENVALGDLEALQGVVKFPVRIKCATLGWNTLLDALDAAKA